MPGHIKWESGPFPWPTAQHPEPGLREGNTPFGSLMCSATNCKETTGAAMPGGSGRVGGRRGWGTSVQRKWRAQCQIWQSAHRPGCVALVQCPDHTWSAGGKGGVNDTHMEAAVVDERNNKR